MICELPEDLSNEIQSCIPYTPNLNMYQYVIHFTFSILDIYMILYFKLCVQDYFANKKPEPNQYYYYFTSDKISSLCEIK